MAAAVSDWRPSTFSSHKIKKARALTRLCLTPTPDILAWLGKNKRPGQAVAGFALETRSLMKNATAKLKQKNCDLIVANYSSAIGMERSSALILTRGAKPIKLAKKNKSLIADKIIHLITCGFLTTP